MIDLPKMTLTQAIATSIYYSLQLPQPDEYVKWANNWLSGADRSQAAAAAVAAAAKNDVVFDLLLAIEQGMKIK